MANFLSAERRPSIKGRPVKRGNLRRIFLRLVGTLSLLKTYFYGIYWILTSSSVCNFTLHLKKMDFHGVALVTGAASGKLSFNITAEAVLSGVNIMSCSQELEEPPPKCLLLKDVNE